MGRTNVLAFLLILAVGIGIGFAIGGLVDLGPKSRNPAETGTRPAPSDQPRDRVRTVETREGEERPASRTAQAADAGDDNDLFTPTLLAYFTDEIQKAWRVSRDEEIPPEDATAALEECRRQTLALPGAIGKHRAEERTKEEKAAAAKKTGDAAGVLAALKDGREIVAWEDAPSLLERMVARRGSGRVVDGPSFVRARDLAEDKLTIEFPAGCYAMDSRRLWSDRQGTFPSDIQISGAGMNATLLNASDLDPRSEVTRFSMRDLTLYTERGGVFDARRGSVSSDFERVRMIGFDIGAGGSNLFDVPSGGIACRFSSCEILGGFGSSPGGGHLLRNGPAVMLFQGCRLQRFDLALGRLGTGSRVSFQGCVFSQMPNPMVNAPATVRFSSCAIEEEMTSSQMDGPRTPRPVTELFPNCR